MVPRVQLGDDLAVQIGQTVLENRCPGLVREVGDMEKFVHIPTGLFAKMNSKILLPLFQIIYGVKSTLSDEVVREILFPSMDVR